MSKGRGNFIRGDKHWSLLKPDNLARGDNNGSRTKPENLRRGEAHGRAKLTAADIPVIRADPREHRVIAADYGVAHSQIGRIKLRKTWKHVAPETINPQPFL